jgi:tRNA pseudouridine38-40 synthase
VGQLSKPTYKLTLEYDGSRFSGWQTQDNARTVQGELQIAANACFGGEVDVQGAGRTDAGVHALGQVAGFVLHRSMEAPALMGALNARLPPAVRVVAAEAVADTFHARFNATRKCYRYRIWNADVLCPFERAYAWHVSGALDRAAMAAAAALIVGRHDFAAFQAAGSATTSTDREVFSSVVSTPPGGDPRRVMYEIAGSGFLRHMVRNIVGSLVEIGRGRRPVEWIGQVLDGRARTLAGPTAPPQGLVLVAVEYGLQSPFGHDASPRAAR